jgi:hypothetical protein
MKYQPEYHSFLVRLWLEDRKEKGEDQWHIEVESIQTGQKYRFPDPEAMFGFFQEQIIRKLG